MQMRGTPAQFSLGKSFRNFTPVGPWLTTADKWMTPTIWSFVAASTERSTRTRTRATWCLASRKSVSYLSDVVELRPGDLIFTGSPARGGSGSTPSRVLTPGDTIVTSIERLGRIENHAV